MNPKSGAKKIDHKRDRKRILSCPKKSLDICAGCKQGLEPESKAVLRNGCEKGMCIECKNMSIPEYELFTKMSTNGDMQWYSPVGKHFGTSANPLSLAEISGLITSKVSSASAIADIVKGVVEEPKSDITESIDEVKERVDDLEKNMAEIFTILEVKPHVEVAMLRETSKIKKAILSHLEDEVRRLFRQERDRDSWKLSLKSHFSVRQPQKRNKEKDRQERESKKLCEKNGS